MLSLMECSSPLHLLQISLTVLFMGHLAAMCPKSWHAKHRMIFSTIFTLLTTHLILTLAWAATLRASCAEHATIQQPRSPLLGTIRFRLRGVVYARTVSCLGYGFSTIVLTGLACLTIFHLLSSSELEVSRLSSFSPFTLLSLSGLSGGEGKR